MKLGLLILLIASVGIYAHKRVTILDITGEFKDTEYTQQPSEGSRTSNINYTLRPDLKVTRVVDGSKRIWQSLHVGEDCIFCHVINHNRKPALVMLYIQQFNNFLVVKRYRLFHEIWVPISKRFYNEIAKAIVGFEGLEFDLDVDLSQGFDLDKLSVSRQTTRTFTNVKLTPNVGYHIDRVRFGDIKLWERTEYQEEAVEINMIINYGKLTHVHVQYETYYSTVDSYYFKFDKEWKRISKRSYYHKNDGPNTLTPYVFPTEPKDPPTSKESQADIPVSQHPDPSLTESKPQPFDFTRPLQFRRFPRLSIRHDNLPENSQRGQLQGYLQNISLEPDVIVVLDDDEETNQQSQTATGSQTGVSSQAYSHQTLATGTNVQLGSNIPQHQPSTSYQPGFTDQSYVWYGHDDSSTSEGQQVYTWYGYKDSSTSSQTVPQYSYTYGQPCTSAQTVTTQSQYVVDYQQPSTSSQQTTEQPQYTVPSEMPSASDTPQNQPIYWYLVESDTESHPKYEPRKRLYTYEPATIGESLQESIYPYQQPSTSDTSQVQKPSETPENKDSSRKQDKPTERIRQKSSESATKSDEWHWYKQPQTTDIDQPPRKKPFYEMSKKDDPNQQITISTPDDALIIDDLSLEDVPGDYLNLLSKSDEELEKELRYFESYYMDFDEDDAYATRHKRRRGDTVLFFEKMSDLEVRGKEGVNLDLFELDDANPDYIIEIQSYYSVPIFKITPAENKFFKEVNADQLIVWRNQDRGMCLVIKAFMMNGEFGGIEAIVKRYSNKCYLHYRFERGYYRSVHTPTYVSAISNYALELYEEARLVSKEEAERVARRQREAAKKAGMDEREIAVREYVRLSEGVKDLRYIGRKRKVPGKKQAEEIDLGSEPLCLTTLRKGRTRKRKKDDQEHEDLDDDEDEDEQE